MATLGTKSNGTPVITSVNDINFFDVKRFMANRAADLLFGQGVVITSESDEVKNFLSDFAAQNELDDLLLQAASDTAYGGRVVLTLDKAENGNFIMSYANNELLQNVLKFEVTPFKAILLKKKVIGLQVFFINEVWTTMDVTRSLSIFDEATKQIRGIVDTDSLPPELDIPATEHHGLGFVPFIEITNKPARNLLITTADASTRLHDDDTVRYMATHINNGLIQWYKEEILGKSRAFGSFTESALNKLKSEGKSDGEILTQDYLINTNPTPNQSKPVETIASTYQSSPWSDAMKVKVNTYAIGCGYSPIFSDSSDQTEAETLFTKDNDTRTTKAKRRRWNVKLQDIIAKLLVYKGFAADIKSAQKMFSLEIKENVVYNQLQLTDFLAANIDAGLMTRVEAIMTQRDLDNHEDAETILKEIEKDQQEVADKALANDAAAMSMVNNNEENQGGVKQGNGGGIGKMGKGKDADPKSEDN